MIIPVSGLGRLGLVVDIPFEELPLNAWTAGRNVRFRDGAVEKFSGQSEVFASPSIPPYWLLPVNDGSTQFWLYGGATKVGATDGSTHADISRTVGGAYATDLDIGWTGTVLEGIPVISNGVDAPQMWSPAQLGTALVALTNFPAGVICGAMRSLKRYLVALDVTKSGLKYPFMIKWSHEAPAGGIPASWDETDETVDAAEYSLPADGGFVVDLIPLRDYGIVYKEYQTWLMQFVGGIDVFRLTKKFDSFGSFTRRAAIEFFSGKQIVFTGDDVVLHDGQQAESLLDKRAKALVRGIVDSTYYRRSFLAINYSAREIWVCVPEQGQSITTKALVWNWVENTWGVRDLPSAAFIGSGIVDPISADETWAGAVGDWDAETIAWGDRSFDPSQRSMLMAVPGVSKLYLPDSTQQFAGVNMTSYVERESLGFPLKVDAPPDFTTMKQLLGLWPRLTGTQGGVVNVYAGTQQVPGGAISYSAARPFVIGTSRFLDFSSLASAPLHALKFESTSDVQWKLHAYDVEVVARGKF